MPCSVCHGTPGQYPIHDMHGRHVFDIDCPACDGTGVTGEEAAADAQALHDRMRYDQAMALTRAAQGIVTPSGDETRSGSAERSEVEPGPEGVRP